MEEIKSFSELNLSEEIYKGIADVGYEKPTPIQSLVIPHILAGKDIIGSAQTGTGKTGAFVIPILERLLKEKKKGIRTLILTPTRELATQISEQIWGLGYYSGVTSAIVIGGTEWAEQSIALKEGMDIVVATPGRFIDHSDGLKLDLSGVEILVLDEADRMLDMGFIPAVKNIINRLPKERQTLLFSATIPFKIRKLVEDIMKEPEWINVASFQAAEKIKQYFYQIPEYLKASLIAQLVLDNNWKSTIIFSSTKRGADKLAQALERKMVEAVVIHGDKTQEERDIALNKFKSGTIPVIVATDVIARGIDINGVSHVVNYDVPADMDDYIHRIGRTGRKDLEGDAITLVSPIEKKPFGFLIEKMGIEVHEEPLPDEIQLIISIKKRKEPSGEPVPQKPEDKLRPKSKRYPVKSRPRGTERETDNQSKSSTFRPQQRTDNRNQDTRNPNQRNPDAKTQEPRNLDTRHQGQRSPDNRNRSQQRPPDQRKPGQRNPDQRSQGQKRPDQQSQGAGNQPQRSPSSGNAQQSQNRYKGGQKGNRRYNPKGGNKSYDRSGQNPRTPQQPAKPASGGLFGLVKKLFGK